VRFPSARILVFCKAPVPGTVNTRLLSVLSAEQAASLHGQMSRRILDCCLDSSLAEIELWCSPDTGHEFFREYNDLGIPLYQQRGSDIGERMRHGAEQCLSREGTDKAVIIGTDLPTLNNHYLKVALERLHQHDVVIGPAEDGGYGLLGIKQPYRGIFENMAWGSGEVCGETCRRLEKMGESWLLLPSLWDVDRPEDLDRYMKPK